MTDAHSKLFKRVEELFFRLGIKALTMDDVASELGISKKTLYQVVENKDDLIKKVIEMHLEEDRACHLEIEQAAVDAVDEMLLTEKFVLSQVREISPAAVHDLQKYHREAWDLMHQFHQTHALNSIRRNLEWGRREGFYHTDFDIEIVARLHVANINACLNEALFPHSQFRLEDIVSQSTHFFLRSIFSEKGQFRLLELLHSPANTEPVGEPKTDSNN